MPVPGLERIVAYLELAKGQLWRLQRPVTLYSLRQKFFSLVVLLYQELTRFSWEVWVLTHELEFKGAELLINNLPDNLVRSHVLVAD